MAKRRDSGRDNGFAHTQYAHVVGWGVEIPDQVMTNHDIAKLVDTNDAWIQERTGIRERRIADERDDIVSLGTRAARKALTHADILPDDIDLVVVATSTPINFFPSTACLIQDRLGATHAGAFDILAACTGFVYALGVASSQIKSGTIETAIVIGTETFSRVIDWTDRSTCILFGDGAAAFVLQASTTPGGIREVVLHSDGSGGDLLATNSGIRPAWNSTASPIVTTGMNGREIFRFATRVMAAVTEEVVHKAGLTLDDIALIIPHQANLRIIEAAARNMHLPMDRFMTNLDKYGNTSTASIPIAVAEAVADNRIKPDDNIVLVGFGGGLTWGAALIEWHVTQKPISQAREFVREGLYIFALLRSMFSRIVRFLEAVFLGSPTKEALRKRKDKSDT